MSKIPVRLAAWATSSRRAVGMRPWVPPAPWGFNQRYMAEKLIGVPHAFIAWHSLITPPNRAMTRAAWP